LQLAQWFLRRRFLCEFPIESYVKLSSAVVAILVEGTLDGPLPNCVRCSRLPTKMAAKLKIEKRGDEIKTVVSEEKIFM
jgi:hypothetical protein